MNRTKWVYWGYVRAESADFPGAWLDAKIRPRWYWTLCRIKLFLNIVWRVHDEVDGRNLRLDWETAWDVSGIIYANAFTGPMRVNCGPMPEVKP